MAQDGSSLTSTKNDKNFRTSKDRRIGPFQVAQANHLVQTLKPEELVNTSGGHLSPRDQRIILTIALARKFSAMSSMIRKSNKSKQETSGAEQVSKALLGNSTVGLTALLYKLPERFKEKMWEQYVSCGLAFLPTSKFADIPMENMNFYSPETQRQMEECPPSGKLSRQIIAEYTSIMFSEEHATIITQQAHEMEGPTAMAVTKERGGLYSYLGDDTEKSVCLDPPFLDNADSSLVTLVVEKIGYAISSSTILSKPLLPAPAASSPNKGSLHGFPPQPSDSNPDDEEGGETPSDPNLPASNAAPSTSNSPAASETKEGEDNQIQDSFRTPDHSNNPPPPPSNREKPRQKGCCRTLQAQSGVCLGSQSGPP